MTSVNPRPRGSLHLKNESEWWDLNTCKFPHGNFQCKPATYNLLPKKNVGTVGLKPPASRSFTLEK